MDEEMFNKRKQALVTLVEANLISSSLSKKEKSELLKLLALLQQYSFENRLLMKGQLSHTIIDSMEVNYAIGERFTEFDQGIK